MEVSPTFQRARVLTFACISFISLLWIVLLCLEMFWRWDISDRSERSLVWVMLLTNTITLIMLLVLILLPFRSWLDAARLMFLILAHIGTAAAFTYWNPKFYCPTQTSDEEGSCKLLNMYILIGSWVNPTLLIAYALALAFVVYYRPRQGTIVVEYKTNLVHDTESQTDRLSTLSGLPPDIAQQTAPDASLKISERMFEQPTCLVDQKKSSLLTENRSSTSTSGRLSKRIPVLYF